MKLRWLFTGAIAFCLVLIFFLTGIAKPLASFVRWSTRPLVSWSAHASEYIRGLTGRSRASEVVLQEVEERIANAALDRVQLQALEEENKLLRAQLNFLQESGYQHIGARVISRELQNGRMHFLLDRGTRDAIEVGQAVVTGKGVFIGKILSVRERASVVEVFTDPDARTIAARAKGGQVLGIIEGRGNGAALLTYIPPSETLIKDDLIVTAGTEEKVPAGLAIGIINRVNGKPTDPFFTAALEPLLGLDRISLVSILRPRE